MPISVQEVVLDVDLARPFTIHRSSDGKFVSGKWQSTITEISGYGVIADPTDRELEMVPEGDRVKGVKVFWSASPIYGTRATEGSGASSDILIWRDLKFRVLDVRQFQDYGYYRAVAVRMKAD